MKTKDIKREKGSTTVRNIQDEETRGRRKKQTKKEQRGDGKKRAIAVRAGNDRNKNREK